MDDLNVIGRTSVVYVVMVLAYMLYRREWLGVTGLVLGYVMFAQLLLTELKIGGVSPKVPALGMALALAGLRLLNDGAARRRVRMALPIIGPLVALGTWTVVRDMLADGLNDASIARMLSDQGMTVMALIAVLALTSRRGTLEFFAWTITGTLMVSTAVAALQFFNVGEAWDVYRALRPISVWDPSTMAALPVELGGVPGLAASTIQEAYLLLSFGGLSLAYFLVPSRQNPLLRVVSPWIFVSFCTVLFLARSRSGTWLMLALAAGLYIHLPLRYHNVRFGRTVAFSAMGIAAVATAFLLLQQSEQYQMSDLSKMEEMRDVGRVVLARQAVEEILNAPLLGIGPAEFLDRYGLVAHNTVLNAGTYYGIPGIVILVWFWLGLIRVWRGITPPPLSTTSSWIAVGGLFGVLGYNLNGMFHNESVITGGLLGAFAIGIWLCGSVLERTENLDSGDGETRGRSRRVATSVGAAA